MWQFLEPGCGLLCHASQCILCLKNTENGFSPLTKISCIQALFSFLWAKRKLYMYIYVISPDHTVNQVVCGKSLNSIILSCLFFCSIVRDFNNAIVITFCIESQTDCWFFYCSITLEIGWVQDLKLFNEKGLGFASESYHVCKLLCYVFLQIIWIIKTREIK